MKKNPLLRAAAALAASVALLAVGPATAGEPGDAPRVLRYAFPIAETGFDPAQLSDLYSRTVTAGIFETPLAFEYLARPVRLRPSTAESLPDISDDFRRFTFRLKRGIHFADDPTFEGRRRELVAADYVYSIKRHYDPRWKSPNLYLLENARLLGLTELRKKTIESKQPFPYDTEVEGIRALDRYTFEVRLAEPSPRFHQTVMADPSVFGAVAREVVEKYGDAVMAHPVGTGPFRLAEWRRSSRIVLERNPNYRDARYDEVAPAGDAVAAATAARLRGRKLPLVDRVVFSIIEESQPRWLAFLNGETDFMDRLPNEFIDVAVPNGKVAPHLARRDITMDRAPLVDVSIAALFNHEHPVVGGNAPERVALRRAVGLAYNAEEEIRVARKGQAIPSQLPVAPMAFGYAEDVTTEMSEYSPARAKALLDLYGYIDRDGDGWRDQPDGSPLELEYATQPDQQSRQLAELWNKCMRAVGLKMVFKSAKWPENLKASRAGKLMMWGVGWSSTSPDGDTFLGLAYAPNKGGANHARFNLPQFDELYIRQNKMPNGPERERVMREAGKLMVAYMPYKISGHRIATDLMHPWVQGYRRNPFVRDFYRYVDSDPALRQQAEQ